MFKYMLSEQKNYKSFSIILIVITLLIIGGWYLKTNNNKNILIESEVMEKQLPSIEMTGEAMVDDLVEVVNGDIDEMTEGMEVILETKSGSLIDVTGGTSRGSAIIHRSEDSLIHMITARLPELASGTVYEGWLVKRSPELEFFSTGVLEKFDDPTPARLDPVTDKKIEVDDAYTLNYKTNSFYEGFDFVVITLETVVDEKPEAHILEGEVK